MSILVLLKGSGGGTTDTPITVTKADISLSPSAIAGYRSVPLDPAAPSIAGQTVVLSQANLADPAQFSIAGKAITFNSTLTVDAAAPRYAGQALVLDSGLPVTHAQPSIAGQAITLTPDTSGSYTMGVVQAEFSLAGQAVAGYRNVPIDPAAFSLSGSSVAFVTTIPVTKADIQPLGQDITLTATGQSTYTLPVTAAAIQPSPSSIGLQDQVAADPAQFSIVGQAITLTEGTGGYTLPVTKADIQPAGSSLLGQWANKYDPAQPSIAGQAITLFYSSQNNWVLEVNKADITFSPSTTTTDTSIPVESVALQPSGSVGMVHEVVADPAQFSIVGQSIGLSLVGSSYNLPVTHAAVSITPVDVGGEQNVDFDVAQAAVQGQAIAFNTAIGVTEAAVSLSPQVVPLGFTCQVTRATPSVAGQTIGLTPSSPSVTMQVTHAAFSVVGQTVLVGRRPVFSSAATLNLTPTHTRAAAAKRASQASVTLSVVSSTSTNQLNSIQFSSISNLTFYPSSTSSFYKLYGSGSNDMIRRARRLTEKTRNYSRG